MPHIQTAQGTGNNTVAFAEATLGTTTTGNFLIAACGRFGGTVTGITDDGLHTWHEVGTGLTTLAGQVLHLFYTENITGRAAHKVRFTMSAAGAFPQIIVSEHSTVLTSLSADTGAVGGPTSSTAIASAASAARAQASELLIGVWVNDQAGNSAFTAGTNVAWTIPTNGTITDGGSFVPLGMEYFYAAAGGTEAAQASTVTGDSWVVRLATFKLAAGGAAPFNGSAGPVPDRRRQPNVGSADPLKLNLRSQDRQFAGAGQFQAYDYPNPKGRPFPSDLRNFFDPSEVWLFGTDKQFAGPGQFKSYDYPNPKGPRRSIDLLTWTSNGLTSRLPAGTVAVPFFQSEFPNPRGPRAASDNRGFVGFYVIDDNAPFVPVAFDNPRGRQRSIDALTAATSNALATLLGVAAQAPFAQTDYPNPRGPRAASDLRTWLQGAITAAQPVPFVPMEFANPRTAGRAVDLRTWLISLQGSTLAPIAAAPFSQRDWPNPRGRAYPVDLRGFLNAMEAQLIGKDTMFGVPGEVPAYDWQNPIRLKRLPLSYVQNWLTYAPDQIYFRRTQFYRLGGRGAGRR